MAKYDVLNMEQKKVGEVLLSDKVFGADFNMPLVHEVVIATLANKHLGTASTKTRGEVKSSNIKPYKQKGTGRARHGSWVSPLFVGGGITFGPRPRDCSRKINREKRRAALCSALSSKCKENKLLVIDKWVPKKKTKEMAKVFKGMNVDNALLVLDAPLPWLTMTVRNIPRISVSYVHNLNTYNIMAHDYFICTKDVVAKIEEGFAK